MLDAADTNGDGEIDKDEFVAWYGHARAKLEKAVETLFRVFPGALSPWRSQRAPHGASDAASTAYSPCAALGAVLR
jgi:hypothetical protein